MPRSKNLVFLIASMIIFGTNGLLVARISLPSAQIVLLRTFFGFLFLLAVVAARRSFSFAELKSDLVPATVGGVALGLNWVLLFGAYRYAGVSISTLVYYCGPMIAIILSPIVFKERLTANKLIAVIAVAGRHAVHIGKRIERLRYADGASHGCRRCGALCAHHHRNKARNAHVGAKLLCL